MWKKIWGRKGSTLRLFAEVVTQSKQIYPARFQTTLEGGGDRKKHIGKSQSKTLHHLPGGLKTHLPHLQIPLIEVQYPASEKYIFCSCLGGNLFLACHAIMRLNAICIKNTSAESTPVDRRLGFFFLCTAVRPVVGEPGVSLSPGQQLT